MSERPVPGNTIEIAGMVIEIMADEGENWRCRNLTTREPLSMKKAVIDRAIKLGQAEVLSQAPQQEE